MRVLFVNQSFAPDRTATAQYLFDLARELVQREHEVHVLCSDRDYLDHTRRYPASEDLCGIQVHRVSSPIFPRTRRIFRYCSALSMNLGFACRLLFFRRVDRIVVMTTPPLIDWLVVSLRRRATPVVLWAMDLNPDQAIRTGWFREGGMTARSLYRLQRFFLKRFSRIVILDKYMQRLLKEKGIAPERIAKIPLWSDLQLSADFETSAAFRRTHDLDGKFVVMYAGNHSVCHPLDTLLEAARELQNDREIRFLFVGGGARYGEVQHYRDTYSLSNIQMLPYQPRESLSAVLSAADLQMISMGDEYVGIVHPSKIYHLLQIGKPVILLGPSDSSVGEILREATDWSQVDHGDVNGLVLAIRRYLQQDQEDRVRLATEYQEIAQKYSCSTTAQRIEQVIMDAG